MGIPFLSRSKHINLVWTYELENIVYILDSVSLELVGIRCGLLRLFRVCWGFLGFVGAQWLWLKGARVGQGLWLIIVSAGQGPQGIKVNLLLYAENQQILWSDILSIFDRLAPCLHKNGHKPRTENASNRPEIFTRVDPYGPNKGNLST